MIGNSAFEKCTKLETIDIPNSVVTLGNSAFSGCTSLANVSIGNGVKTISKYAFNNCSSLESVHLGSSIESVGYHAFYGCTSLNSINWRNSIKYLYGGAFYGCTSLGSVELSSKLELMDDDVFQGCTSLTDVTINEGCTVIGNSAFEKCTKLKTIDIPNSVVTLGNSAFSGCSYLTNASIGDGVKVVGKYAFNNCSDLKEVRIGSRASEVGYHCFYGCSSLTSISVYNTKVPETGSDAFNNFDATLKVPAASIDNYKAHAMWGKFSNIEPLTEPTVLLSIIQADGGHLKQAVAVKTQCTFLVVPEDGWEINAVIFNGEDVTNTLIGNIFVTPALSADAVLQVSFHNKTDVNSARANSVKAYGYGNDIVIKGAEAGDIINVYSIDGVLLNSTVADGGDLLINAISGAVYIVKSGDKTIKVAL